MEVEERVCHRCGYEALEPGEDRCPHDQRWLVEAEQHHLHPHDPFLGRILGGRYPLLAKLGQGGMGAVYRSTQPLLGRDVAVKVISAQGSPRQGKLRASFLREARSVARLKHPAIVALHDFGAEPDGLLYMVLELVEGTTMRQALCDGEVTLGRLVATAVAVLDGLAEAHAAGVVHRDLKPENIMLTEVKAQGRFGAPARILDFGLAVMTDPGTGAGKAAQSLLGTPYYIAPEHATGAPIGGRADIFSLGAILYEALRGRPAFPGANPMQVIARRLVRSPTPLPVSRGPDQALAAVVARALQRNPADRFADARAMQEALETIPLGQHRDAPLPAPTVGRDNISTESDDPEVDDLLRRLRDPDPQVRVVAWQTAAEATGGPLFDGAAQRALQPQWGAPATAQAGPIPVAGSGSDEVLLLDALVRADTGDDEQQEAGSDGRAAAPGVAPSGPAPPESPLDDRPPSRPWRSAALLGAVALPLLAGAALLGAWLGARLPVAPTPEGQRSATSTAPPPAARASGADASVGTKPNEAASGAPVATSVAADAAAPPAAPALQGMHELRSRPAGAEVVDESGRLLGRTPLRLVVPAGGPEALYRLRAPGRRSVSVRLPRDGLDHTSQPTLPVTPTKPAKPGRRPPQRRAPPPPPQDTPVEGRTGRLL